MYDALSYIDTALERGRSKTDRNRKSVREERAVPQPDAETWRKVDVADGVELLVRDDIYRRRRDQIDWLVDWAQEGRRLGAIPLPSETMMLAEQCSRHRDGVS